MTTAPVLASALAGQAFLRGMPARTWTGWPPPRH